MPDFAHYVSRRIRSRVRVGADDSWFAEHQPESQGFKAPVFHVTKAKEGAPASRVRRDDTIWLFSQLRTPWGVLPPALDAKVVVKGARRSPPRGKADVYEFRFTAARGSAWFPLYDATPCIARLRSLSRANGRPETAGPLWRSGSGPIGTVLQSLRELDDAGPLLAWERRLGEAGFDFVSYRLLDGTRAAFDKVAALVTEGRPVFWDRWSLPRRLAERRRVVAAGALDTHIAAAIRRSRVVWGVATAGYGAPGSYSALERREAERLGKLKLYQV